VELKAHSAFFFAGSVLFLDSGTEAGGGIVAVTVVCVVDASREESKMLGDMVKSRDDMYESRNSGHLVLPYLFFA
jgi:hypothetical protein